jgi:hypothetical protein
LYFLRHILAVVEQGFDEIHAVHARTAHELRALGWEPFWPGGGYSKMPPRSIDARLGGLRAHKDWFAQRDAYGPGRYDVDLLRLRTGQEQGTLGVFAGQSDLHRRDRSSQCDGAHISGRRADAFLTSRVQRRFSSNVGSRIAAGSGRLPLISDDIAASRRRYDDIPLGQQLQLPQEVRVLTNGLKHQGSPLPYRSRNRDMNAACGQAVA